MRPLLVIMKKDILHHNDIVQLVNSFYDKVIKDSTIGPIFNDIAKVNWEHHLPVMYSFWSSILLDDHSYADNPMATHLALNKKHPLQQIHFDVWIRLLYETVDDLFSGEKALEAKTKGSQIAQLMHHKMRASEQGIV